MNDGFPNTCQLSWVYCLTGMVKTPPDFSSRLCLISTSSGVKPLVCTYVPDIEIGGSGKHYWIPKGEGKDAKKVYPYAWLDLDVTQVDKTFLDILAEKKIVGFSYDSQSGNFILKEN